jgi:hypothetical protein
MTVPARIGKTSLTDGIGLAESPMVAAACWIITRLLLVATMGDVFYPTHGLLGDIHLYARWAHGPLSHGHFPTGNTWQYPPGAAGVLGLPTALHLAYFPTALAIFVGSDAAITTLLWRRGRDTHVGAWVWIWGVALLGPIALSRFDVVSALFAVAALMVTARPAFSGALLAVGALIKVWPGLLLVGFPDRDRGRAFSAAVVTASITTLAVFVFGPQGQLSFLSGTRGRGLQVESVAATPFVLLHMLGVGPDPEINYGAQQVTMHGSSAVAAACKSATLLVALGALLIAVRRPAWLVGSPAAIGLALVSLVLVVSPVLSPQYLIWVLALVAVVAAESGRLPRSGRLLMLCAALTQVFYPALYRQMLAGHLIASSALIIRNIVFVMAAVTAVRAVLADRSPTAPMVEGVRNALAGAR